MLRRALNLNESEDLENATMQKFQDIMNAYELLSHPLLRARINQDIASEKYKRQTESARTAPRGTNPTASPKEPHSKPTRSAPKQAPPTHKSTRRMPPTKKQAPKVPDHYAALGITYDATEADIKIGYRKQSMKWHPDRLERLTAEEESKLRTKMELAETENLTPIFTERFQAIANAYAILNDPAKRAAYDRRR